MEVRKMSKKMIGMVNKSEQSFQSSAFCWEQRMEHLTSGLC